MRKEIKRQVVLTLLTDANAKNLLYSFFFFLVVVRYVNGRVLKGLICPSSQITSHMQVNPSVRKGSLFMSRATTGNSLG